MRRSDRSPYRPVLQQLEDRTVPALFGDLSTILAAERPRDLVTADFDRDGDLDVIAVLSDFNSYKVQSFRNDGHGNFTALTPVTTNLNNPVRMEVGDFNRDGWIDVIVTNFQFNGFVTLLTGDGSGLFAAQSPIDVGQFPFGITVGDFNGDGKLDAATPGLITNVVTILLGDGQGGLTVTGTAPTNVVPTEVVAADVNRDGKLDLLVTCDNDNKVTILLGDGAGGFTASANSPVIDNNRPRSIVVADLDGDGDPDFATANYYNDSVRVFLNNGAGVFTEKAGSPFFVGDYPADLVAADFDGDGDIDLASTALRQDRIVVLLNDGNAQFTSNAALNVTLTDGPEALAAGDFDGDGRIDLAVTGRLDERIGIALNTFATTVTVGSSAPQSAFGQAVTLTATVGTRAGTATGTITFRQGATVLGTSTLIGGVAVLTLTNLPTGADAITATFTSDNGAFAGSQSAVFTQIVSAAGVTVTLAPGAINATPGQSVSFSVLVDAATGVTINSGTVTLRDGATVLGTAAVVNGVATFNRTFTAGTHTLTAVYGGTTNFQAGTSAAVTLNVADPPPTAPSVTTTSLLIPASTPQPGQQVTITVLIDAATGVTVNGGTVTLRDGATVLGTASVVNGVATFDLSFTAGPHVLTAVYAPSTGFLGSTSAAVTLTAATAPPAPPTATTTSLLASTLTPQPGQSVTITVLVDDSTGVTVNGGTVTLRDGATVLGTATVVNGVATFNLSFTAGAHMLTAVYGGTASFLASTSTAVALTAADPPPAPPVATTASLLVSDLAPQPGQSVTVTVLIDATSGATVNGGTVTLRDGATVLGTAAVVNGVATFNPTFAAGMHTLTAVYSPSADFLGSTSAAVTLNVTTPVVTTVATTTTILPPTTTPRAGEAVTIVVLVDATGGVVNGGTLTLRDGTSVIGTAAVSNGSASFQITLTQGTHTLTAVFSGTPSYLGSTSAPHEQVVAAAPPSGGPTSPPPPPPPVTLSGVFAVGAGAGSPSQVNVYNADRSLHFAIIAFDGFMGGVSVAMGDVNGDGVADIVAGAGAGAPGGHVKVFDGRDGTLLRSFLAFPGFGGGIQVATGDVNGDGFADVVVGAGPGAAGGHVKVFDGATGSEIRSFFSFPGFDGGITVATGDTNGDHLADLIVGAGPGASGGHVKVFNGSTGAEIRSFFAFDGYTGGVTVAAGDTNGDGFAEIVVGGGFGSVGGHVKVFDARDGRLLQSFLAFPGSTGGARVGTGDRDGDGVADVLVATGPGWPGGHVISFNGLTLAPLDDFIAFAPNFVGGSSVAGS